MGRCTTPATDLPHRSSLAHNASCRDSYPSTRIANYRYPEDFRLPVGRPVSTALIRTTITECTLRSAAATISSLVEREHFPVLVYIYVDDADDTYQRAVAVRAETVEAPTDQFYGERRATVKDSYGNMYQMASPIESCDAARTTPPQQCTSPARHHLWTTLNRHYLWAVEQAFAPSREPRRRVALVCDSVGRDDMAMPPTAGCSRWSRQ